MNEQIEVLITADEYMNKLKGGIQLLIQYIDIGQNEKAVSLIPDICDGIDWVIQVIELSEKVKKQNICINSIDDKLLEIIDAIKNEDYILIADLFNYEILPLLESIHNNLKLSISN